MPMNGSFDANQFQPKQIGESHPVGKFPATISATTITPTKDNSGGMFVVDFTTPVGQISMRYNLWNQSPKAVEIAHGQLSALCHATGIFRLDWSNDGAALRGGRCMIDVGYQKGQEPSQENPAGGYVEVKKVYDQHGNEPGKPAAVPQPQQMQAQPQVQPQTQSNSATQNGGWGNPAPQVQPSPPQPTGWTQQAPNAPPAAPPWAK